ncbi:hypothetical protein QOT17_020767 [Balamuthia mandrillaris]
MPRAKRVKRQPPYVCEHLYCSPQRFVAQDTSTLNRHERRKGGGGHTCNATNCTTCKRWENHRLGKKNPNDLRFECRHSVCGKRYKSEESRREHEATVQHTCSPDSCARCKEIATRQDEKGKEKEKQEQAKEEVKKQREEEIEEAKQDIMEAIETKVTWDVEGNVRVAVAKAAVEGALQVDVVLGVAAIIHSSPVIEGWLQANLSTSTYQPCVTDLVWLKNVLHIPDRCWELVVHIFKLSKQASLHQVRKKQCELLNKKELVATKGGKGSMYQPKEFVQQLFSSSKLQAADRPVLKLAFDGSTAAKKTRLQMEVGTMEFISKKSTLKALKSSHNCHPWLLYLGNEDGETLIRELGDQRAVLNDWIEKGVLLTSSSGELVHLWPYIVVDLKALAVFSGMYQFYRSNSTCRCFWCNVTKRQLAQGELSAEETRFRTLEDVKNDWKAVINWEEATRRSKATDHHGQVLEPVLFLNPMQVIPDLLHLLMGVVRKLINKTIELAAERPRLQQLFVERMAGIGIYLIPAASGVGFKKRIKDSRLNRREHLIILENHTFILADLEEGMPRRAPIRTTLPRVRQVWAAFHQTACLAMQEKLSITDEEWKQEAKVFLQAFIQAWNGRDVTTYIHVFVDHLGYWLEREGSVEKFSNFGIETTHADLKRMMTQSTQGFAGINSGDCSLPQQLLERQALCAEAAAAAASPVVAKVQGATQRGERSWAERNLEHFPDLQRYIREQ